MSAVHLGSGSPEVKIKDDRVTLYSMRFCPYAHRILLTLTAKNIKHDVVNINLRNKPEWFVKKFPLGKVPSIVDKGESLYESLIIADYLNEKYPEYPLYPRDPMKKAKDKIVIDTFQKVITLIYKIYRAPSMDSTLLLPVFNEMDYFEEELTSRGTTFFFGTKPGMVDYMIWPWCERLEMIREVGGEYLKVPRDRFKAMWDWSKAMLEDEVVKKYYLTPEEHAKFFYAYRAGETDLDNIL